VGRGTTKTKETRRGTREKKEKKEGGGGERSTKPWGTRDAGFLTAQKKNSSGKKGNYLGSLDLGRKHGKKSQPKTQD